MNKYMDYIWIAVIVIVTIAITFASINFLTYNKFQNNSVNVLQQGKLAQLVTQNGKKTGTFYVVKMRNHQYILFESGNKFGMTHYPDCECRTTKFRESK